MVNKRPTVYLHIGMNKTGSTALQACLSSQRSTLLQQGIYYPEEGLQGGAHYGLSDALGFKHSNEVINEREVAELQQSLVASLQRNNCHTVVFSSENFVLNQGFATIKQFFANYNCKIIVYLRRHDYWWESAYNQSLKMVREPKFAKGLEAFIQHQKTTSSIGNYKSLLDRWAQAFGKENIIVRPYEKTALPHGIEVDFLSLIGAKELKLPNQGQHNVSLSKRANAILEVAQRAGLKDNDINNVLLYLKSNDQVDNSFSLLSPKRRRIMLNNYFPQYQYIAANYLTNAKGLFSEKWPDINDEWQAFLPPTPEEILNIILKAIYPEALA